MSATRIFVMMAVLVLALPPAVLALDSGDRITDACQIQWVRDHRDGPGLVGAGYPVLNAPEGVQWVAVAPIGWTGGAWEIQIGDAYDTPATGAGMLTCYAEINYPATMVEWSQFITYSLDLTNNSTTHPFDALLMINTGATGLGEPDNLYSTAWTTIPPGATVVLTMDLTPVVNLNHVSNISFKMRSEEPQIDVVVYGGPDPTPTIPSTWGRIKTTYEN